MVVYSYGRYDGTINGSSDGSSPSTTTVSDALNFARSHALENLGNGATGPRTEQYIVPANLVPS